MNDIVDLIRLWAADPEAPVPPVIPTEYALMAADEIERLRESTSFDWKLHSSRLDERIVKLEEELDHLRYESRVLAQWLMHPYVFVHERIIEEVDIALVPYLGKSNPLR
jgi:hypothetical protein